MLGTRDQHKEVTLLSVSPGGSRGARVRYSGGGSAIQKGELFKTPGRVPSLRLRTPQPVVVSLHPLLCHSEEASFLIDPEHNHAWRQDIGRLVEDLLYKRRGKAGERLGLSEMDTVLVDAHIDELEQTKDGVHGVLHGIFTSRDVFESVEEPMRRSSQFFFTHPLKSALTLLRYERDKKAYVLFLEDEGGLFYGREPGGGGGPVFRKGTTAWTPHAVVGRIAKQWGVSFATAQEVYRAILQGNCSPHVEAYFQKVFQKEVKNFFKELTDKSVNGTVFIQSSLPLPFTLPTTYRWKTLLPLPDKFADDASGVGDSLAPVYEFLHFSDRADLHRAIQRKIHWIAVPKK